MQHEHGPQRRNDGARSARSTRSARSAFGGGGAAEQQRASLSALHLDRDVLEDESLRVTGLRLWARPGSGLGSGLGLGLGLDALCLWARPGRGQNGDFARSSQPQHRSQEPGEPAICGQASELWHCQGGHFQQPAMHRQRRRRGRHRTAAAQHGEEGSARGLDVGGTAVPRA
eukprot:scaffold102918_cov67-Phaeocystis_antarctica.AAC.4